MEAAGQAFKRAAAVSRRKGLRSVRARAYHGLLRVAAMLGEYEAAKRHADKALRLFADHREHTHVVHDTVAMMLWEDPEANAKECSNMLRAMIPLRRSGVDRISSLTLLVRAAGYARDAGVLPDAWFDAVRAIERLDDSREAARLLLDLARAGSEAPGIDAARIADIARRAFNMAARVDDRPLAHEADTFRQELWRREH
jgi:tetratricopeptide (TPR) repeat protein